MAAEITSVEYKPAYIPRYLNWCAGCEGRTYLRLDVDEPTCDRCSTPYEKPEIAEPVQTCVTPFVYGRPLL